MSVDGISFEMAAEGVALLRFDRPQALNALDTRAREAMAARLAALAADAAVKAVVLTGAGERGFCAGQDVKESAALGPADGPRWMESWKRYFKAVSSFPKPLIAAANGVAAGAGFESFLMADLRLAVPGARLIMAEVDIGLPAIVGQHLLKVHLGLSRTVELVLTGRTLSAEEALAAGLVREIVPAERLLERALALAAELAAKPPLALALDLARFRQQFRAGLAEAEEASARYQAEAIATGEPQQAMARFLEKRCGVASRTSLPFTPLKDSPMTKFIKIESNGEVAVITLNRPEVMNAWHSAMRVEITEALRRLNADPAVRALIMTGAGDRAFCAGQDLNEAKSFDAARAAEWIEEWRRMYSAIRELDKPLVMALNGVAAGSAFQVALQGDVRVAHPAVRMGQPEINSGIPSTLGPWLMREMLGLSRTIELTLTGRMMEAAECHAIGLIHRLVPTAAEVMPTALAVAGELAAKPPVAMRLDKRRFREVTQPGFDEALEAGIRIQKEAYATGEPARAMEAFFAARSQRKSA